MSSLENIKYSGLPCCASREYRHESEMIGSFFIVPDFLNGLYEGKNGHDHEYVVLYALLKNCAKKLGSELRLLCNFM